jgi:hypothetical protein
MENDRRINIEKNFIASIHGIFSNNPIDCFILLDNELEKTCNI